MPLPPLPGSKGSSPRALTRPLVQLVFSAFVAALAIAFASRGGRSIADLFQIEPAWPIEPAFRLPASLGLGLALGTAVVAGTRRWILWTKAGQRWLETMGAPLVARTAIVPAVAGAIAEELTFRGLLVPLLGIIAPAVAFALLHALAPRDARIAWAIGAFLFALSLGALFLATGDLAGPLAAHVLVNAANTRWIRATYERLHGRDRSGEHARRSGARPLGGLLGPRV
jgi:hypothetical protein